MKKLLNLSDDTKGLLKSLVCLLGAFVVLAFLIAFIVGQIAAEIEDGGLKSVVEEIWEGKQEDTP